MSNKGEINNLFNDILGVQVNVVGDSPTIDEQMFCYIIEKWERAWSVQNKLMETGILLEGYDGLLYDSLDTLSVLTFGKEKALIIHWYVYEGKNDDGTPRTLIDPQTRKEYNLLTPKDLFMFLTTVEGTEFIVKDSEGEEDDDDGDE
jgi:hypothetical protein